MSNNDLLMSIKQLDTSQAMMALGLSLKKIGAKSYQCNCPFHNEKSPSFKVSDVKKYWKCFGCGEAGDIVDFAQKFLKVGYLEALRALALANGIEFKEDTMQRDALYKINNDVANAYAENLDISNLNKYLLNKGVTQATIKKWRIGISPDVSSFIQNKVDLGEHKELFVYKGLYAAQSYDRFTNRLMFPLMSSIGDVIGFAGRTLLDDYKEKDIAKWINSPTSHLFLKESYLYGLNFAKSHIQRNGYCIVVEGYMDCILMHQFGIENIVCIGGTSLTKQQLSTLKLYCDRVVFMFDGDAAGVKATIKALKMAAEERLAANVCALPQDIDPDDFIRNEGVDAMARLINKSVDSVEYLFYYLKNISRHEEFKGKIVQWLKAIKKEDERYDVSKRIAQLMGYSESQAKAFFEHVMSGAIKNEDVKPKKAIEKISPLVKYLIMYGDLYYDSETTLSVIISSHIQENDIKFDNPLEQQIIDFYIENLSNGLLVTSEDALKISAEVAEHIASVIFYNAEDEAYANKMVYDYVKQQRSNMKQSKIEDICDKLIKASPIERQELINELQSLT